MRRANLVVFVASKTATSPPSANHAKTSSSASLQTWQGSNIPHFLNVHLFSDSHPFRIAVVKELVITVQPFSAFLGPLDGPRKNTTWLLENWACSVPDSPVVTQIEHLGLHANPVKIPECSVACVFSFAGNLNHQWSISFLFQVPGHLLADVSLSPCWKTHLVAKYILTAYTASL